MKPFLRLAVAACIVGVLSPLVAAHPGHGEPTVTHYVDEPIHQVQVVALVFAVIITSGLLTARLWRQRRVGE